MNKVRRQTGNCDLTLLMFLRRTVERAEDTVPCCPEASLGLGGGEDLDLLLGFLLVDLALRCVWVTMGEKGPTSWRSVRSIGEGGVTWPLDALGEGVLDMSYKGDNFAKGVLAVREDLQIDFQIRKLYDDT